MLLVRILRKLWRLRFVQRIDDRGSRGECDPPDKVNKEIRILASLKGEEKLEVIFHEILHAGKWELPEKFIEEFSADASRILGDLGWHDEAK